MKEEICYFPFFLRRAVPLDIHIPNSVHEHVTMQYIKTYAVENFSIGTLTLHLLPNK